MKNILHIVNFIRGCEPRLEVDLILPVKKQIEKLKQEMKDTLDINKKIEIAKKIENINKEVLKW